MLLALAGVLAIILLAEVLWRRKSRRSTEASRKFVHILTGIYIAFWPLFLSFYQIQLLCVVLLAGVVVSKRLKIFRTIFGVRRFTHGEALFPLGLLVAASFADSGWVYLAAVLHLTLADGLA